MMKRISQVGTMSMQEAPSYICSTTDFTQATNAEDGSTLMVVNEATHTVTAYYVAFNGHWNKL